MIKCHSNSTSIINYVPEQWDKDNIYIYSRPSYPATLSQKKLVLRIYQAHNHIVSVTNIIIFKWSEPEMPCIPTLQLVGLSQTFLYCVVSSSLSKHNTRNRFAYLAKQMLETPAAVINYISWICNRNSVADCLYTKVSECALFV